MITDQTGRKIKIGQLVNMCLVGMYTGKVVAIKEAPLALSSKQVIPPHIVVVVEMTPNIMQNGLTQCYIVSDPDPRDPLVQAVKEGELDETGLKIIKPS